MALIKHFQNLLLILMILLSGCFNRDKERRPENFIPPEKIIVIMTDLYIADGLLNNQSVRRVYEAKDSTENYIDIISSYGYTQQQLDASIAYLFANNPKRLEAVYDRVIANLLKMEADIMQERNVGVNTIQNYYTGQQTIRLPDNGITNKIEIDVEIDRPGIYRVKSRVLLYEDDQSIDPFMNLWYWYDDNTEDGHIERWDTLWLKDKGRSNLISYSSVMADTNATHIRGYLFNHVDQPGHWEKHATFSNIIISQADYDKAIPTIDTLR